MIKPGAVGAERLALWNPLSSPGVNPVAMKYLGTHTELVQYTGPYPPRLCAACCVEAKPHLSSLCVDTDIENHFAVKFCHPWRKESPQSSRIV